MLTLLEKVNMDKTSRSFWPIPDIFVLTNILYQSTYFNMYFKIAHDFI